jgi:hypothetical protein
MQKKAERGVKSTFWTADVSWRQAVLTLSNPVLTRTSSDLPRVMLLTRHVRKNKQTYSAKKINIERTVATP